MKAFPNPTLSDTQNNSAENLNNESLYGMDLRDFFAAKAMQGILSNPSHSDTDEQVVRDAYEIADQMMEARNDS